MKELSFLLFQVGENKLSIKVKKSVLSCSEATPRARVSASTWSVKIRPTRIVYDILCLKYGPDCPLKYGPFSYFTVLTKILKIAILNKLRTKSPAKLHCKFKFGICVSFPVWEIYDIFLHFDCCFTLQIETLGSGLVFQKAYLHFKFILRIFPSYDVVEVPRFGPFVFVS